MMSSWHHASCLSSPSLYSHEYTSSFPHRLLAVLVLTLCFLIFTSPKLFRTQTTYPKPITSHYLNLSSLIVYFSLVLFICIPLHLRGQIFLKYHSSQSISLLCTSPASCTLSHALCHSLLYDLPWNCKLPHSRISCPCPHLVGHLHSYCAHHCRSHLMPRLGVVLLV